MISIRTKHRSQNNFKPFGEGWIKKKMVPHDLTVKNLIDQISMRIIAKNGTKLNHFFKRLFMGDEKWITYDINIRKRLWSK